MFLNGTLAYRKYVCTDYCEYSENCIIRYCGSALMFDPGNEIKIDLASMMQPCVRANLFIGEDQVLDMDINACLSKGSIIASDINGQCWKLVIKDILRDSSFLKPSENPDPYYPAINILSGSYNSNSTDCEYIVSNTVVDNTDRSNSRGCE